MRPLKTIIVILAGLILSFGPILQIQTVSASVPVAMSPTCGTSTGSCCSMESPSVDYRSSDDGCQCRISGSQEPFDVDANTKDSRVSRDIRVGYELLSIDRFVPFYGPGVIYSAVSYDAGKSPPAYILACSFLI